MTILTPPPACDVINNNFILLNHCVSNNGGVTMLLQFWEAVVSSWSVSQTLHFTMVVNQRVTVTMHPWLCLTEGFFLWMQLHAYFFIQIILCNYSKYSSYIFSLFTSQQYFKVQLILHCQRKANGEHFVYIIT